MRPGKELGWLGHNARPPDWRWQCSDWQSSRPMEASWHPVNPSSDRMAGADRVWTGHPGWLTLFAEPLRTTELPTGTMGIHVDGLSDVSESIDSGGSQGNQEVIRGELGHLDHSGWGLALNTHIHDRYEGPLTTATQTSQVPPRHRSVHQYTAWCLLWQNVRWIFIFLHTVRRLEELKVLTQYLFHRSSRSFLSRDDLKYMTSSA